MSNALAKRVAIRLAAKQQMEQAIARRNEAIAAFRQAACAEALARAKERTYAEVSRPNANPVQPCNGNDLQPTQATTDLLQKANLGAESLPQGNDNTKPQGRIDEEGGWTVVRRKRPIKTKRQPP